MSEGRAFEYEKREQSEAVWQKTHVLFLKTHEQHFPARPASVRDFYETFVGAQRLIQKLLSLRESPQIREMLDSAYLWKLGSIEALVEDPKILRNIESLIDAPITDPLSLAKTLETKHPHGAFSIFEGDRQTKMDQVRIARTFQETSRHSLFSITDSHRATADLFRGMEMSGWEYQPEHTALLSFDHHPDTEEKDEDEPLKATVMRFLLENGYIAALGVIGSHPPIEGQALPGADFIEGRRLYRPDGTPSTFRFEKQLKSLFQQWKQAGIKEVYLSVDLDGLRLKEVGYSSTDYAVERGLWAVLVRLARIQPFLFKKNLSPELTEEVWDYLRFTLRYIPTEYHDYYGIPAAWILHAVRLAKKPPYSFRIGITDQNTGKVLLGDIAEVSGADRRRHGERITTALLEAILKETAR